MTPKQREQYDRLRDKVHKAFIAWESNQDKSKNEKLHKRWIKALNNIEAFEERHL